MPSPDIIYKRPALLPDRMRISNVSDLSSRRDSTNSVPPFEMHFETKFNTSDDEIAPVNDDGSEGDIPSDEEAPMNTIKIDHIIIGKKKQKSLSSGLNNPEATVYTKQNYPTVVLE